MMIDLLTVTDIVQKTEATRVTAMRIGHTRDMTDTKRVGGHPLDRDSMKDRRVVKGRGVPRDTQFAMTEKAVAEPRQMIKRDQLKRGGTHLKERRHHMKS